MYKRKKFNLKNYYENDCPAKMVVTFFLQGQGYKCTGSPYCSEYASDIICYNRLGECQFHEMSRTKKWVDDFPYTTIYQPAYKKKYVKEAMRDERKPKTFFWVMSYNFDKAYVISGQTLLNTPVKRVHFHNSPASGEDFCFIDFDKAKFFDLSDYVKGVL